MFGEDHEGDHSGGFQVFHVEWERVEIPYAIGLWIILTAIIKVGKSRGLEDYSFPNVRSSTFSKEF